MKRLDDLSQVGKFINRYPIREISPTRVQAVKEFNKAMNSGCYSLIPISCNICHEKKQSTLFKNDRSGIKQYTVICTKCGLVFSSPRLSEESTIKFYSSDTYRLIYNDVDFLAKNQHKYRQAESYQYKPLDLEKYSPFSFLDFLYEAQVEFDSVCEIGAGGGANLIPFIRQGKQVIGYDYSESLVQEGQKWGINLIQGSIEHLNLKKDLILLIHVLEHLLDPVGDLIKIREHVNKYLLIEIPGIVKKVPSIQNAHQYYFSVNTLLSTVSMAGFSLIKLAVFERNGYIIGLFHKDDASSYEYDYSEEVKNSFEIFNRFKLTQFPHEILKALHIYKPVRKVKRFLRQ